MLWQPLVKFTPLVGKVMVICFSYIVCFCVCFCVCVCVCVCVRVWVSEWDCVWCLHLCGCTPASTGYQVSCSSALRCLSLETGYLTSYEDILEASQPFSLPVFKPHSIRVIDMCLAIPSFCFCFKCSYWDLNLGLHFCSASIFTQWANLSAQEKLFFRG